MQTYWVCFSHVGHLIKINNLVLFLLIQKVSYHGPMENILLFYCVIVLLQGSDPVSHFMAAILTSIFL